MSDKETPIPWSRQHGDIHEDFILDYCDFVNGSGDVPAKANQDMKYVMGLQRTRLEDYDIEAHIEAESTDTGTFADQYNSWQDNLYEGRQHIMPCLVRRTFRRGEKKLHHDEASLFMYQTSVRTKDPARTHDHPFTCPNCGNASTVGQLQQGCPFCGTHFKHTDLFPRISNFFFLENASLAGRKLLPQILKFYPLALLLIVVVAIVQGGYELTLSTALSTLIGAFILAYPLWALFTLVAMFYKSGKSVWLMITSMGSKKRFQRAMADLDPNFSFDYFAEKAILLLEMLVFSDDPRDLPVYENTEVPTGLKGIVQLDYCGAVALRRFRVEGDTCSVDVEIYADVLRYTGDDLHKERDVFSLTLSRNVHQPLDIGYSPLAVRCHSCSGSFDAVHQKHCPYCGTPYENDHRDWTAARLDVQKNNPLTTLLGIIVVVLAIPTILMLVIVFANFLPLLLIVALAYFFWRFVPARKSTKG